MTAERSRVTVHCCRTGKPQRTDCAWQSVTWAATRDLVNIARWRVTHLPSGWAASEATMSRTRAVALAKHLEAELPGWGADGVFGRRPSGAPALLRDALDAFHDQEAA